MFKDSLFLCALVTVFYFTKSEDDSIFNKFRQNDYYVKDWRIITTDFNQQLLSELSVISFKFNRTTRATNVTIKSLINLGEHEVKGFVQIYKRYGTKYVEFPITMNFEACQLMKYNVLGLAHFTCGHLRCPFLKGVRQHVCNFIPDFSRLPPFLPDGDYNGKVNYSYNQQYLTSMEFYGTIYRKINILENV